mmetsp:Transcript_981/g.1253  ORF Transcript_981/g.1253 Transcript_981/m.1253 type:complete len:106 (-) Transcript_981:40-357(-)
MCRATNCISAKADAQASSCGCLVFEWFEVPRMRGIMHEAWIQATGSNPTLRQRKALGIEFGDLGVVFLLRLQRVVAQQDLAPKRRSHRRSPAAEGAATDWIPLEV